MTIMAKIIADSVSEQGIRLTTIQLRYPRFIHAEFLTHRVFSRNASSSRAIPVERVIEDIINDTAMPIHWGKNQPGMQAREEHRAGVRFDEYRRIMIGSGQDYAKVSDFLDREDAWFEARNHAVTLARAFAAAGYHKQIVNRLLEPFAHINVLVSATEYSNFFALRDHPDAQPEIQVLAAQMKDAMEHSTPKTMKPGEWHLPYVTPDDCFEIVDRITGNGVLRVKPTQDQINEYGVRLSVARCARVSYLTVEGKKPTIEADLALYDRLLAGVPLHASPAEHQATPDVFTNDQFYTGYEKPSLHGNFSGWIQYRKTLPGECQ